MTFIPGNIVVTVVHVPDYHDVNDQNAIIIVQMKSGNTMPVPVSKLSAFLTNDPPKPAVKFNPGAAKK